MNDTRIRTTISGIGTAYLKKGAATVVSAKGEVYQFTLSVPGMGLQTFQCANWMINSLSLVGGQKVWFKAQAKSRKYTCKQTNEPKWFNYFEVVEMAFTEKEVDAKLQVLGLEQRRTQRALLDREIEYRESLLKG